MEERVLGFDVTVSRTVTKGGTVIRRDSFVSNYSPGSGSSAAAPAPRSPPSRAPAPRPEPRRRPPSRHPSRAFGRPAGVPIWQGGHGCAWLPAARPQPRLGDQLEGTRMYPDDLKYTNEHEWARAEGDQATIGITHTPRTPSATSSTSTSHQWGRPSPAARPSARSSRPSRCPTSTARSRARSSSATTSSTNPELINSDPYGQGWLVVIELTDPAEVDQLMDAAAYSDLVAES